MTDSLGHRIEMCCVTNIEEAATKNSGVSISLTPEQIRMAFGEDAASIIKHQRDIIDEFTKKDKERQEAFMDQGVQLMKSKKEIRELHRRNTELENIIEQELHPIPFEHCLDTRCFTNISKQQLIALWDNLFELSISTNKNNEYIIKNATGVVPVFLVMKNEPNFPFKFVGTYRDFVYFWNENIALRQPTEERAQKLALKEATLKAAINEDKWKKVDVTSWYRLSLSGKQDSETYSKAEAIRKMIESFTY